MRVLFVCDGNICRSPMASAYMSERATNQSLDHVGVDSAGLLGIEDSPASEHAIQVCREAGLDLTHHRSKALHESLLRPSDLVIGMTLDHLTEIEHRWPGHGSRILLLRAFERSPEPSAGAPDLDDPVGAPLSTFRACFATIRSCLDHLVLHLKYR